MTKLCALPHREKANDDKISVISAEAKENPELQTKHKCSALSL